VAAEIESIAGHLATGDAGALMWFVIVYSDGDEEHREGTLVDATELASSAGLAVVPAPAGSYRWARHLAP
jgi:hypothetical protein